MDFHNVRSALNKFEEALPFYRVAGNQVGETTALANIGGLYYIQDESARALEFYQRALEIQRTRGDRAADAVALANLGIYRSQGDLARS